MTKKYVCQFNIKELLVGGTNIVKSSDKSEYTFSGHRIAFGVGSWRFDNGFVRNVVIFV